uniref:Ubiquitin-like domain-containing protein n=2 Tax=Arion vulgaris TaxID=1028688 RepID=A0A0B7BL10_9EUPU
MASTFYDCSFSNDKSLLDSGRRCPGQINYEENPHMEVEVYIKVIFKIQTWDGVIKQHEADLPCQVKIRFLKEELQNELGDPDFSDWVIAKNGIRMSDDATIYNEYPIEHKDQINVFVHKSNAKKLNGTQIVQM